MALWLARVNARSLRLESRKSGLIRNLQHLGANVCCEQEARCSNRDRENILIRVGIWGYLPSIQHVLIDAREEFPG